MRFTDYYAQASCTAGRANFITGELPIRTGLTTVGQAGSALGMPRRSVFAAGKSLYSSTYGAMVRCQMTSKPLTPQIGRIILAQLEELKRESAIVLEGFNPFDAWDSRRIAGFLEELEARGFIAARYDS
jgi:hypothetical protein